MSTMALPRRMTVEELLAMSDDGMERWIINGELREKTWILRDRFHSCTMGKVSYALTHWLEQPHENRGVVLAGQACFRFPRPPETMIGIDVAYVSSEVMDQQGDETTLIEGSPVLAVEILSPSDTQQDIHEKIKVYLEAGTKLVWIIDPDYQTVTVFAAGKSPVLFNQDQTLTAEPHLPGFSVAVQDLFI